MNVHHYIPPPDHPLHPYLHSLWSCGAWGAYARETILPTGIVDILFNLAQPFRVALRHGEEIERMKSAAYVVGLQTGTVVTEPEGEVLLFGISLRAEACSVVLPVPAQEITGAFVDATQVFRDAGELTERLYEARDFQERCRIALAWLAKRIAPDPQAEMVVNACRLLNNLPTGIGIDRVASDLNLSSRHLRRLFLHHLGVGPSGYIRLSRFIRALGLMAPSASLTEIAHASCYYDQAHFCRDFKEIAGMTPRSYLAQAGPVRGHLFST